MSEVKASMLTDEQRERIGRNRKAALARREERSRGILPLQLSTALEKPHVSSTLDSMDTKNAFNNTYKGQSTRSTNSNLTAEVTRVQTSFTHSETLNLSPSKNDQSYTPFSATTLSSHSTDPSMQQQTTVRENIQKKQLSSEVYRLSIQNQVIKGTDGAFTEKDETVGAFANIEGDISFPSLPLSACEPASPEHARPLQQFRRRATKSPSPNCITIKRMRPFHLCESGPDKVDEVEIIGRLQPVNLHYFLEQPEQLQAVKCHLPVISSFVDDVVDKDTLGRPDSFPSAPASIPSAIESMREVDMAEDKTFLSSKEYIPLSGVCETVLPQAEHHYSKPGIKHADANKPLPLSMQNIKGSTGLTQQHYSGFNGQGSNISWTLKKCSSISISSESCQQQRMPQGGVDPLFIQTHFDEKFSAESFLMGNILAGSSLQQCLPSHNLIIPVKDEFQPPCKLPGYLPDQTAHFQPPEKNVNNTINTIGVSGGDALQAPAHRAIHVEQPGKTRPSLLPAPMRVTLELCSAKEFVVFAEWLPKPSKILDDESYSNRQSKISTHSHPNDAQRMTDGQLEQSEESLLPLCNKEKSYEQLPDPSSLVVKVIKVVKLRWVEQQFEGHWMTAPVYPLEMYSSVLDALKMNSKIQLRRIPAFAINGVQKAAAMVRKYESYLLQKQQRRDERADGHKLESGDKQQLPPCEKNFIDPMESGQSDHKSMSCSIHLEEVNKHASRPVLEINRAKMMSDLWQKEFDERLPKKLDRGLLPFQREGVKFGVIREGRCLLADEMGVGKTVQAIAMAAWYRKEGPLLVVCPASMRFPWAEELERWLPNLNPNELHLIFGSRDNVLIKSPLPQVTVVSYTMLKRLITTISRQMWAMVIIDESHNMRTTKRIEDSEEVDAGFLDRDWMTRFVEGQGLYIWKNGESDEDEGELFTLSQTQAMMLVLKRARRAVLLSGTPSLTRPFDLFNQIDCIRYSLQDIHQNLFSPLFLFLLGLLLILDPLHRPGFIGRNKYEFARLYCDVESQRGQTATKYLSKDYSNGIHLQELNILLTEAVMIRRLKNDVLSQLPPKRRQVICLHLEPSDIRNACECAANHQFKEQNKKQQKRRPKKGPNGEGWKEHSDPSYTFMFSEILSSGESDDLQEEERESEEQVDSKTELKLEHGTFKPIKKARKLMSWQEIGIAKLRGVKEWLDNHIIFFKKIPDKACNSCEVVDNGECEKENLGEYNSEKNQKETRRSNENEKAGEKTREENMVTEVSKLRQGFEAQSEDEKGDGEKMIIFAHHYEVLDAIEEFIVIRNLEYVRIDGQTPAKDRQAAVAGFRSNPKIKIAVVGVTAGGVGLDFSSAQTVVFAEVPKSAADMLQAEDRAHRRGQRSAVNIYVFCAKGSQDEMLWQKLSRSVETVSKAVNGQGGVVEGIQVDRVIGLQKGLCIPESTHCERRSSSKTDDSVATSHLGKDTTAITLLGSHGNKTGAVYEDGTSTSSQMHLLEKLGVASESCSKVLLDSALEPSVSSDSSSLLAEALEKDQVGEVFPREAESEMESREPKGVHHGRKIDGMETLVVVQQAGTIGGEVCELGEGVLSPSLSVREENGKKYEEKDTESRNETKYGTDGEDSDIDLLFQVSPHTGRIHLHGRKKGQSSIFPFHSNFRPEDLQTFNAGGDISDEAVPEILHKSKVFQAAATKFLEEWEELRPIVQKKLTGRPLSIPLDVELAAMNEQSDGSLQLLQGLLPEGSNRRVTPRDEAGMKPPECATWREVNVRTRGNQEITLSQAVSEIGEPLCQYCRQPCLPLLQEWRVNRHARGENPRMMKDLFCSFTCLDIYLSKTSASFVRDALFDLERGVCSLCKLDCYGLVKKLRILQGPIREKHIVQAAPAFADFPNLIKRLVEKPCGGNAWHADHITAVYEGGGECGLENLRTLCVVCHLKVTNEQKRRWAEERQQQRKKEKLINSLLKEVEKEDIRKQKELAREAAQKTKKMQNRVQGTKEIVRNKGEREEKLNVGRWDVFRWSEKKSCLSSDGKEEGTTDGSCLEEEQMVGEGEKVDKSTTKENNWLCEDGSLTDSDEELLRVEVAGSSYMQKGPSYEKKL